MSYKSILVPTMADDADVRALAAAAAVARRFTAHIGLMHIRRDPASAGYIAGDGMSPALLAEIVAAAERDAAERAATARRTVDRWLADEGLTLAEVPGNGQAVTATWRDETGSEPDLLAAAGRLADLVVTARDDGETPQRRVALEALLLETGRPVIAVPPHEVGPPSPLFETVAVAWNGSVEASRAVALALPVLAGAGRVVVITAGEASPRRDDGTGLRTYLATHGIKATLVACDGESGAGAAILATAADQGTGLLVMGAYTHGRLRQMIFGGVTSHVLEHAALPVLMAH